MIRVRDAGGVAPIGALRFRDASGIVNIATARIRDAAGLQTIFSQSGAGFTVDVPASAYGGGASGAAIPISTEEVIATIAGGRSPYSYVWSRVDTAPQGWTIISPASNTTRFRANTVPPGVVQTATFRVAVTDANSVTVNSIDIVATAENYGDFN